VNAASAKTVAVLTISDSSYIGKREDASGPAIVRELEAANFKVIHKSVLPDEKDAIAARLIAAGRRKEDSFCGIKSRSLRCARENAHAEPARKSFSRGGIIAGGDRNFAARAGTAGR
jgi:hypothetical protein